MQIKTEKSAKSTQGTCNTLFTRQVDSALHPSGVAKSSTSFGWGKGGEVTSAGWQVTLCDLIWHVISRSGVVISITNCYIRFTYLLYLHILKIMSIIGCANNPQYIFQTF